MGKNQNAKRDKKSKFKEKEYEGDQEQIMQLELEAAERGMEVWELQKERDGARSSSDEGEDNDVGGQQPE